eukprot:jgi/Mesvir1/5895/Mv00667-RA.1
MRPDVGKDVQLDQERSGIREMGLRGAIAMFFQEAGIVRSPADSVPAEDYVQVRAALIKRLSNHRSNLFKFGLTRVSDDYTPWLVGMATTNRIKKYADLPAWLKEDFARVVLLYYLKMLHFTVQEVRDKRPELWEDWEDIASKCWDKKRVRKAAEASFTVMRCGPRREWDEVDECFKDVARQRSSYRHVPTRVLFDNINNPWPYSDASANSHTRASIGASSAPSERTSAPAVETTPIGAASGDVTHSAPGQPQSASL